MDNTKKCPYCAEKISKDAIKCKHCGEILDADVRTARQQPTTIMQQQAPIIMPAANERRKWIPGVAAILSLVIPGIGQMYRGQIGLGLLWLIIVPVGYFLFIIPGVVLHLICIITAASGDPYKD